MPTITYRNKSPKLAAAMAALGVPIHVEIADDEHTGKHVEIFHIKIIDGFRSARWIDQTLKRFRSGQLEKIDSCHPLLDGLRGIRNLCRLESGERVGLYECESAGAARTGYRAGSIAHAADPVDYIATRDILLVAALGIAGCPVVRKEGDKWTLACGAMALQFPIGKGEMNLQQWGRVGKTAKISECRHSLEICGAEFVAALRNGTLQQDCPTHPVLFAYHAARIYRQILIDKEKAVKLIAIKKPGAGMIGAVVRSDITGKGMDKVARFFGEYGG